MFADDEPAGLNPELQTARFTEENALSARKHDLFSVLKQKKDAFIFEETWLFHVAEVDYTVPAGAKEDGAIQPALAVSEGAPNEKSVIEEMDKRTITARFEERNVLDPHDPTFDIVIQQNKIVAMKHGGLAFLALHTRSRRPPSILSELPRGVACGF